jgi:general L-amino acid transport system substrate-binding protein
MKRILMTASAIAVMAAVSPATAGTLDTVKERGAVRCGVSGESAGFSAPSDSGEWRGLDVDYCRAVAAAVFGDGSKVQFVALTSKERFAALQAGEIDVLSRTATWTLSRDTSLALNFVGALYYDGQGFMVNSAKLPDVKSAKDLAGATVCTNTGTTTELNMADYFKANGIAYQPLVFEKIEEVRLAYEGGRCDAYTTDQAALYAARAGFANPGEHTILPEVISREPLSPAVRQGDDQWFDIAKWTLFGLLNAEMMGVTKAKVEAMKASENPEIKRMLGQYPDSKLGADLGVSEDWVANIVAAVGNYGEMFERNLGSESQMKISRGLNRLWSDGGLHYAPPIR